MPLEDPSVTIAVHECDETKQYLRDHPVTYSRVRISDVSQATAGHPEPVKRNHVSGRRHYGPNYTPDIFRQAVRAGMANSGSAWCYI